MKSVAIWQEMQASRIQFEVKMPSHFSVFIDINNYFFASFQ